MNASANPRPRKIRAVVERKNEMFIATSPDLKGLVASDKDLHRLQEVGIPRAIEELFDYFGVDVVAMPVPKDDADEPEFWYPHARRDVEGWISRRAMAP